MPDDPPHPMRPEHAPDGNVLVRAGAAPRVVMPDGTTPTNRFNTCYRQPPDYTAIGHPACGAGAPSFAISNCEDYVGQDFVRATDLPFVPCGGFDTGGSPQLQAVSNAYWCDFDPSYLDVDCHGAGATCTGSNAFCIKRASTTGGCSAIANALKCRKWQADFRDGSVSAEDVYLEGCAPVWSCRSAQRPRNPNALETCGPTPGCRRRGGWRTPTSAAPTWARAAGAGGSAPTRRGVGWYGSPATRRDWP